MDGPGVTAIEWAEHAGDRAAGRASARRARLRRGGRRAGAADRRARRPLRAGRGGAARDARPRDRDRHAAGELRRRRRVGRAGRADAARADAAPGMAAAGRRRHAPRARVAPARDPGHRGEPRPRRIHRAADRHRDGGGLGAQRGDSAARRRDPRGPRDGRGGHRAGCSRRSTRTGARWPRACTTRTRTVLLVCAAGPIWPPPEAASREAAAALDGRGRRVRRGPVLVVGDGLARHRDALLAGLGGRGVAAAATCIPAAAAVGMLGRAPAARGRAGRSARAAPLYGRRPALRTWQETPARAGERHRPWC